MALTVGTQKRISIGARYMTETAITPDTSYPTGGWSLTLAQLGLPLGFVDDVHAVNAGVSGAGAVNLQYDLANQKLMAFAGGSASAAQAQINNAVDLSTMLANVQIVAIGK